MSIRIQIPLVIEMDDEQVKEYVRDNNLPNHDGPLRAKDIVEDVRRYVQYSIQGLIDADVTIKGR